MNAKTQKALVASAIMRGVIEQIKAGDTVSWQDCRDMAGEVIREFNAENGIDETE